MALKQIRVSTYIKEALSTMPGANLLKHRDTHNVWTNKYYQWL